ncbi:MAG: redox-sensing transcriptional repressor [Clostridia bacterium]|nr:redox-sensing transcriptional repressor [Clostridia bacterium]
MPLQYKIKIPKSTIDRMPLYHRCLSIMEENGITETSSQVLGLRVGVDPSVIRKDLAWFGELGKRGVGYNVPYLRQAIAEALGLNKDWPIILVGAGKLGSALADHNQKYVKHFQLVGIFDRDPAKHGRQVGGLTVRPMEDLPGVVKEHNVKMAMIAVPAKEAQAVAHVLVKAGIKGILSFAPISLSVPEDVLVYNSDYHLDLQRMAYFIDNRFDGGVG